MGGKGGVGGEGYWDSVSFVSKGGRNRLVLLTVFGVEVGRVHEGADAWDVGCRWGHRPGAHLAGDGGEGWPVALGPAYCRHDGLAAHGVVDVFGPGAGGEGDRPPGVVLVFDSLPLNFKARLSLTSFRCRLGISRNGQRFGLYRGEHECGSSRGFRGSVSQ